MLDLDKIYLGDCLQLFAEIPAEHIDLILTDIPYGINYKSNKQNCDTRSGRSLKKERAEYFDVIDNDENIPLTWLHEAYRVLKPNTAIYVFCHWSKWPDLVNETEEAGFKVKNMIVMNKSNHGMGDLKGSYAPKHELLMYAVKGKHKLLFKKRMPDIWNAPVMYSGSKRLHPTQKPISWLFPCIHNSTAEGDIVLDPFIGSGSTAEACLMAGRKFIGFEINPKYYEVSCARITELIHGKEIHDKVQEMSMG